MGCIPDARLFELVGMYLRESVEGCLRHGVRADFRNAAVCGDFPTILWRQHRRRRSRG